MKKNAPVETALVSSKLADPTMKLFVAIAMILVVVGHISSEGFRGPFDLFPPYSFHVAAFVFVSGYFYREASENQVGSYIKKKAMRLMVPLYAIMLVYGIVSTLMHWGVYSFLPVISAKTLLFGPLLSGHDFLINLPMWFIAPLFFAEVFNVLFRRATRPLWRLLHCSPTTTEFFIFACYLFLGAIAIIQGGGTGLPAGLPLLACRTLFFIACFGMGSFYRRVLEQHDKLKSVTFFAIVVAVQLVAATLAHGAITYTPSWCRFPNGVLLTYVVTITGIAFLLRVSRILGARLGNTRSVRMIADNTFSIMCHHYFALYVVSAAFALVAWATPLFSSFDFQAFGKGLYLFYPGGVTCWAALYFIVAIVFSLLVHYTWLHLKAALRRSA